MLFWLDTKEAPLEGTNPRRRTRLSTAIGKIEV